MNKLVLVAAALSAVAMVGCGKPVTGNITLAGDRTIPLVDRDGKTVEIGAGIATVEIKGIVFPRLDIETATQKVSARLPGTLVFGDYNNFSVKGSEIEQPVDIEVKVVSTKIGTRLEDGYDDCYGPGYCYIYPNHPGSPYYPHPGYPYHPPYHHPYPNQPAYGWYQYCPGRIAVRRTIDVNREVLAITFANANSSTLDVLGSFEGERGIVSTVTKVDAIGSCVVN